MHNAVAYLLPVQRDRHMVRSQLFKCCVRPALFEVLIQHSGQNLVYVDHTCEQFSVDDFTHTETLLDGIQDIDCVLSLTIVVVETTKSEFHFAIDFVCVHGEASHTVTMNVLSFCVGCPLTSFRRFVSDSILAPK